MLYKDLIWQTDWHTKKDRKTVRLTDWVTNRWTDGRIDRHTEQPTKWKSSNGLNNRLPDWQMNSLDWMTNLLTDWLPADSQTDWSVDRRTNGSTDRANDRMNKRVQKDDWNTDWLILTRTDRQLDRKKTKWTEEKNTWWKDRPINRQKEIQLQVITSIFCP